MTNIQIVAAFEREINKLDDAINKPATSDSLYWINQAMAKLCKTRFNGNAPHRTSYEQNEKRTRDLVKLFVEGDLTPDGYEEHSDYVEYSYQYPHLKKDNELPPMMYMLNEDVEITDLAGNNKADVSVFECTADSFMYRVMNSLTDFHYKHHRARPLRIRTSMGCKLLTDGKYKISKYHIGYLRYPEPISLENPRKQYSDFSDDILYEIVKIAAQMYIENQSDKRYQSIVNEVNTQE